MYRNVSLDNLLVEFNYVNLITQKKTINDLKNIKSIPINNVKWHLLGKSIEKLGTVS